MKAMDYSTSQEMSKRWGISLQDAISQIAADIAFEIKMVEACKDMSKVVNAHTEGEVYIDPSAGISSLVSYIVFEFGESDLRKAIKLSADMDLAMILRSLHGACVGLYQMHNKEIAHQDVKPSNIMLMDKANPSSSKIADLGRIVPKNPSKFEIRDNPQHLGSIYAGDRNYSPPEIRYSHFDPDWKKRCITCDLFQFGSVICFSLTGTEMFANILKYLDSGFSPGKVSYADAVPYLQDAFSMAMDEFDKQMPDYLINAGLSRIVRELCNPNYLERGHPSDITGRHYLPSLARYHPRLDRLAVVAKLHVEGKSLPGELS
ncbi:MAG: hypothetical protein ACE5F3_06150 [Mariprofundaceae bacterium]